MTDTAELRAFQSRLVSRFVYEPEDGYLRFRRAFDKNLPPGSIAGYRRIGSKSGYWIVSFEGSQYRSHRLIWLYVHGRWPISQIDHINGNPIDNRLSNLRECSISENGYNKPIHPLNRSGAKGVSFHKANNAWRVRISKHHIRHEINSFATKELASEFASMARQVIHGEFAHD